LRTCVAAIFAQLLLILMLQSAVGAVPPPGGNYPRVMKWVSPHDPLYFTIRMDHSTPFNPTEVSADDPHWTFGVTFRQNANRDVITFINRGDVAIPVKYLDDVLPKSLRDRTIPIPAHSTASFFLERRSVGFPHNMVQCLNFFRLAGVGPLGSFCFDIYDENAYWKHLIPKHP